MLILDGEVGGEPRQQFKIAIGPNTGWACYETARKGTLVLSPPIPPAGMS